MSKIKILYVVSTLKRTGPTSQLLGIINNLDKDKFEASVLTLSPEPSDSRKNEYDDSNIKVDSLNMKRLNFMLFGKYKINKYIQKKKYDIIHTQGVRADGVISKLNYKEKHIMTIRNYVYDDYVAKFGNLLGNILAKSGLRAMKKCKYPVCCSKTLQAKYNQLLNKDFLVVQNGVSLENYSPIKDIDKKIQLRKKLGLPESKKIFISVGNLIERKDPITIIKAFNKVNNNDAVILFLGDGPLMENCKNISNQNIILKGKVSNVNDYLQASDCFISSALSEGLPNSVLEAAATGLELILSDIPQHKEIFEKKGDLSAFFSVKDFKDLKNKIKNSLESNFNKEEEMVTLVKANFSTKIMSRKYQELYVELYK